MSEMTTAIDPATLAPDPRKVAFAPRRLDPEGLKRFVSRCFVVAGLSEPDADLTSEIIVDADLYGTQTHGIALLYTHYIQPLLLGEIDPHPDIVTRQGSPTTMAIDGGNGLGMLVGHRAMSETIRMAEESGSGWTTVYNTTHSAAGAYYARMAASKNMLGFHWSSGGSTIAAPGGSGRLLGNNPFSFAAPAGRHAPFVLDMAPSLTIRPKIRLRAWQGLDLPEGWAVDDAGAPITDPVAFFEQEGSILPLGGSAELGAYKGFGLLLLSDILTGVLSGDGGSLLRRKGEHSSAFAAVRIDAFPTGESFGDTMDAVIERIHAAPVVGDGEHIRYPGERSEAAHRDRSERGIPIQNYVVDELLEMASALGVPADEIWRSA